MGSEELVCELAGGEFRRERLCAQVELGGGVLRVQGMCMMASISSLSKAMRDHALSTRKDKLLGLASFSGSYLSSSIEGNCSSELKEEDLWVEDEQVRAMHDGLNDGEFKMPRSNCRRKGRFSDHIRHHHQSAPVNVPDMSQILGAEERAYRGLQTVVSAQDEDDEDERVPPHELVAREYAKSHAPTFSVYEGVGRTLKGRDMDRVRSAVLRKTGFIDHV